MTFTTTRCLIRPFAQQDIEPFMAYRNDLEWMQHQSFKGLTYEAYERALLGEQAITQGMQLAIIDQETNELIGDLYVQQDRTTYWIGYTISPRRARQGYASEVVSGLIRHLSDQGVETIKAGCLPTNEASIALLKKLNFVYLTTEDKERIYQFDVSRYKGPRHDIP
ncbi:MULTISPECIES: GNAT family N-acetyltransferase [Exiguobacterium]|uniref:GNAT family N-acetyltransferase n=1 Tax=Exiguobacterium TaxID=33986 RepID=UPI001BEC5F7F|nr:MULTISPECIES: GNAT family N-acetyltransferase [Exiguobacterium]MCT4783824.1 GNAT family N-acetyltransferase [Exiguobacterium himgiriensis]